MGKTDIRVKDWIGNKERFADLFNGIVYKGKQVISPYDLENANSESSIILPTNDSKDISVSKRRDIIMNWKNKCNLAVLAVESQKKIHYAMPVRNMLYDSLAYTDQMKYIWNNLSKEERPDVFSNEFFSRFRKNDKLYPVITLVIYFGESGKWDGSISLYDMFDENMSEVEKEDLKKYVPNYKINLVEFDKIEDVNVFKSDLRETIGVLQCRKDKNKMKQYIEDNREALSRLDLEASRIVQDVLNVGNLKRYRQNENGKAVIDVCQAIEDLKIEAEDRMAKLVSLLIRDERIDEIYQVSADKNYRQKMYEEYNI